MATQFYLPVRPYSPIDALNASLTSHADYNGHHVRVHWNDYRGYYIAEYFWAGRVVLARGSFEECLRAALREYDRGALGASVGIHPREGDEPAAALVRADPRILEGDALNAELSWYTWRHRCAAESVRDAANPGALVRVFDWDLMQAANNQTAYEVAIKAKYGRLHT